MTLERARPGAEDSSTHLDDTDEHPESVLLGRVREEERGGEVVHPLAVWGPANHVSKGGMQASKFVTHSQSWGCGANTRRERCEACQRLVRCRRRKRRSGRSDDLDGERINQRERERSGHRKRTVHVNLLEALRFGVGRRLSQQLLIDARLPRLVRARAFAPDPANADRQQQHAGANETKCTWVDRR